LYYFGARYLDPQTSRWVSPDPALEDYLPVPPVDDEARRYNSQLPGMGGVFNPVNINVYCYAGTNPVKFIDPNGKWLGFDDAFTGPIDEIVVFGALSIAAAFGSTWAIEKQEQLADCIIGVANKVLTLYSSRGKNKLEPDPSAQGNPHTRVKRDPVTGEVTNYETYKNNPYHPKGLELEKGYDGKGKPHYNKKTGEEVDTPHIHDPNTPGGVRKPEIDEIPKNLSD
jgi:hypothetical protein